MLVMVVVVEVEGSDWSRWCRIRPSAGGTKGEKNEATWRSFLYSRIVSNSSLPPPPPHTQYTPSSSTPSLHPFQPSIQHPNHVPSNIRRSRPSRRRPLGSRNGPRRSQRRPRHAHASAQRAVLEHPQLLWRCRTTGHFVRRIGSRFVG